MTYFSDEILIFLIALGLIGAALAWRILVLLKGPCKIETSQLVKLPAEVEIKQDLETKTESLDLTISESKPSECLWDNLRTEKDPEIKKLNDRIDKLEMVQEIVQEKNCTISKLESENDMFLGEKEAEINGQRDDITPLVEPLQGKVKEMTNSREQLESNFHMVIADKEEEISRLKGQVDELKSLAGQLKKCESSKTDFENHLRQRTGSFKKQVEGFQARIRELEPMKQLAEERLVSLTQLKEKFHSFRMEKEGEITALKQNLIRFEHL